MLSFRFWLLIAFLLAGVPEIRGQEITETSRIAERAAHWLSPQMRRLKARSDEIKTQLEALPKLAKQPFASRYGYRSQTLAQQDEPHWVKIDLGTEITVDRIVSMPVHVPSIGAQGAGYGFPLRFKIEVADNPAMEDAFTVVDHTGADVPNPGRYPLDFPITPVTCRYVRFTSTKHFPVDEGFMWALEELLILAGNRSVAIRQPIEVSTSLELYPNWSMHRIHDGQSALGLPVTTDPSPTKGYLSSPTSNPDERKWLRIDLENEHVIHEIRMLSVRTENFETLGERSFPRGWMVELAQDPSFGRIVWRQELKKHNLVGFPGNCAISLPVPAARGRYLRLVTLSLWGGSDVSGYAIAEFQAYSGNQNVALGKPVLASDAADLPENADWTPAAVVDGFSSHHRLIEIPEYLDLIGRRGKLEAEAQILLIEKNLKVRSTGRFLVYGGTSLGGFLAVGWAWMIARQRSDRERAVIQLREQIARDLHDDIGSNLGGIALLSEMGAGHSTDPQAREDFQIIRNAADEASASMRDIVWLIQRDQTGLRDQIAKMRQSAEMILVNTDVSLAVEPHDFPDHGLSLLFRRHVLFAFKETLNNIRKHAHAARVIITIGINPEHLTFSVRDDGSGFDMSSAELSTHGLGNLKRRAERLKGTCHIESGPGHGTTVTFTAPLKS